MAFIDETRSEDVLEAAMRSAIGSRVVKRVVDRFLERRAAGVDWDSPVVEMADLVEAEDQVVRDFLVELGRLDVMRRIERMMVQN